MDKPSLQTKKLGLWAGTALVVGNMIGSGVFLLPASLAVFGSISLIGWLIASAGAVLLAVVFGNLSRMVPGANGGPYAFTKATLGAFPGFLVAWGYWISVWTTNAAITVALVSYLSVFFPVLAENRLVAVGTGLAFIWLLSWLNTREVRKVGAVQLITTILKVAPLLLIGIAGLFYIQADNFLPFNAGGKSDIGAVTAATVLTLFAFLGMESATIPNSSIKNPGTTIKRATIIGTGLTILVYITGAVAVTGIIPQHALADSNAPFADAAAAMWGGWAR
ncbi:MAG: amino acid permease, partial [Sinomicrobium sp.]|nr:amino acid permease [Sinomicrobium sp.]